MAEPVARRRVRAFVAELRRRRVLRVLAAYVVFGFSAAEGADLFLPSLGFPAWTVSLVAVLVVLGFPIAIGLAWAFDVVPDTGDDEPSDRAAEPPLGDASAASPPLDPAARWSLVQDLFLQALEREGSEREAFLTMATRGDSSLLAEVRSLLTAHGDPGPLDELRERVLTPMSGRSLSVENLEGETVLHYEILEKLGSGGMGVVYKARDTRLGRIVTLKFLSTHLLTSDDAKQRFMIEAQAAASLDHPNLCTIHEIGETDDGHLYIAMAFYDGETLQRRIARGRVNVTEALDVTAQVCRGLARAAEHDIIHRDIKPGNLMLTADGVVKIVDFGLAKRSGGALTQTGTRMGTVAYMSPEQTRGETVDQRADVWSVGVVLYEMLTGRKPFRGGSDQAVIHSILNDAPVAPEDLAAELSPAISAIVMRALAKEPTLRYPDAGTLLKDVERLLADPDSRAPEETRPSLPPEGERRLVTVFACAISGFEALMDTLEPEAVEQRLAQLRGRVQSIVEDYGGVLNDFSEDRVVALFGVPVTHEDDALRAVRAALELHSAQEEDATVDLRSAIGSGQVAIRATEDLERPYRLGGTVTRDVARLAVEAGPGEILVFGDLTRTVTPFVETEERRPVTLSSDRAPIIPLAVLGESQADSKLDASLPGTLTRFVGRTDELSALTRALATTNSSGGRLVSVVGDAGVGKSRLLHEFRTTLADDSIRYVQGRCQAHGGLTPFLPFIECVRAMLGMARSHPDDEHDQVVARTRALTEDLEVYVPVLLHLLAIESDEYPLPNYLTGEDLSAAVADALVSLFTLGSREQPLVLLLEDWHWSDGGSVDVLSQLSEMISTYPLLVVVTGRPPTEAQSPIPRGQVHLDLQPLEVQSAIEIMRAAFGGARLSAELSERVVEKTGGNPFFIEELCHTLADTGAVVIEDGTAELSEATDRLTIPDTVQAVLKTRLDRLDPEEREVLRSASVVGRQFGLGLLGSVVPSESRLPGVLDRLRASGLIQRTSLIPEPTYRFKHALTLDVTYDSLLERQRKERHLLVGEALEAMHGGRLDDFSDRLAHHFAGAEDWDRAVQYGLSAAERAAGLWRLSEAVATLDRAHEWIERQAGTEEDRRALLVDLLLQQERYLETLGRRERQQALINELLTILPEEPSAERATAMVRQGELSTLTGRYDVAERAFEQAVEVATACGAEEQRLMARRGAGHRLWRLGLYQDALAPLTEVVEHDRVHADSTILVRDLVNLGRVLRELGRWDEAEAIGEEVGVLSAESGNAVDQVYAANYVGHLLRAMGKPKEAIAAFARGSAIATEAHLHMRHSFHLLATAALYLELGQTEESLATYDEAIELAVRASRPDNIAHAMSLRGEALMMIGRPGDAVSSFAEATSLLRTLARDDTLAEAMTRLARASEADDREDAGSIWRDVRALREELGDPAGALEAAEHEARLIKDDPPAVHALYETALDLAIELDDPEAEARVRNSLALLAWRASDMDEAAAHFEAAAARMRAAGITSGLGVLLNAWGALLTTVGEYEKAEAVLSEALTANRADGASVREADSLSALGALARARADFTRAYDWYQQCLESRRASGDRAGEGWALHRLAELSIEADAPDRAETFSSQALSIAMEIDDTRLQSLCAPGGSASGPVTPS
ncbi:MAG: protein kinase [Gemmatimonadetes bacterium]|nr:protein kinase [Gemmatimonadota bacterium]